MLALFDYTPDLILSNVIIIWFQLFINLPPVEIELHQ